METEEEIAVREDGETVASRLVYRKRSRKRLLLFPGIGYGFDRFLLSEARQMALSRGYEVLCLSYGDIREKTQGGDFLSALGTAAGRCLDVAGRLEWEHCDVIKLISKSFGTLTAGELRNRLGVPAQSLFLTPLPAAFSYMKKGETAAAGDCDPFISGEELLRLSGEREILLHLFKGADHSLEVKGDSVRTARYQNAVRGLYADFL